MDWQIALVSGTTAVVAVWLSLRRPKLNLPSPVPGLPFLGNTLQVVNINHLKLDEWKDKYGPIYSLDTWGGIVVVVANAAIASDLLDKMSAVTSSRPDMIMLNDLMTRSSTIVTQKYGDRWRKHRRGAHESLRYPDRFYPVQEHEAHILLRDLIVGGSESELELNLRRTSASTIWRETYGGPPLRLDDPNLSEVNDIADEILAAIGLGSALVDALPFLKRLPTSLAPFKQRASFLYADRFFARSNTFFMHLADEAIKRKLIHDDPSKLNFCASLDERKEELQLSDGDVAWISATMFTAGAETSSTVLHYFVLAMILHPDVVRKAHEELDTEVGDRPPTFSDRDRLPYIEAIVKEVMRWRPVVAMGGPHAVTEDFFYQGYTIPKGTIIINNLWSITHDPALFDDPDAFMPERFLNVNDSKLREPNTRYDDLGFGYGRRICSGRHVAVNSIFINAATLLWAFGFHKAVDPEGKEITPSSMDFHYAGGTVRSKPFPFRLVVRSASARCVADSVSNQ